MKAVITTTTVVFSCMYILQLEVMRARLQFHTPTDSSMITPTLGVHTVQEIHLAL